MPIGTRVELFLQRDSARPHHANLARRRRLSGAIEQTLAVRLGRRDSCRSDCRSLAWRQAAKRLPFPKSIATITWSRARASGRAGRAVRDTSPDLDSGQPGIAAGNRHDAIAVLLDDPPSRDRVRRLFGRTVPAISPVTLGWSWSISGPVGVSRASSSYRILPSNNSDCARGELTSWPCPSMP